LATERVERRLAAILAADVAGYSRLMGADEEGTHERLKAQLLEVVDPKIKEHRGHTVKNTGDGVLVEFPSVVDAVRCAADIQRAMIDRNADTPEDKRISFRIGINIGDVIVEPEDIFGDGVNIAARLEGIAEPGGICISRVVHDQILDKLPYQFEDMGEQSVKNIARPVRAYAMNAAAVALLPSSIERHLVETIISLQRPAPAVSPIQFPEFGRQPAIAVMPFRFYTQDDEPFTDGLTEELINALSRWRSFPVIARNSVFAYRGRDLDVRLIGRELGARYIVSGSIRRRGAQARVTLELVDAETAENLLSERHEHASADPFALQDELVRAIAGVLAPEVLKLERERAVLRPAAEAGVYDLYERGMWHRYRNTREDLERAETIFRQVLEIEPGYARATAALSLCRNFAAINRWVADVRTGPAWPERAGAAVDAVVAQDRWRLRGNRDGVAAPVRAGSRGPPARGMPSGRFWLIGPPSILRL
jgi:adenylate cyclase